METMGSTRSSSRSTGLSRRAFLRVGTLGLSGLTMADVLQARALGAAGSASHSFGRARRCILLFLTGGPSQLDTFDLKPSAPVEVRGEFKPIATATVGVQIGELFPRLAAQSDKFRIVRSVTHRDAVHTSAGYTMLTGVVHDQANSAAGAGSIKPGPNDHPHLGSLMARFRSASSGMPPFVALPEIIKDAGVNEFPGLNGGLLGKGFDPFRVEVDATGLGFRRPEIVLPDEVTTARLADRRALRDRLTNMTRDHRPTTEVDSFYRQAFDILSSPLARRAFVLDEESPTLRAQYGEHLFGRGCLLARRLIERKVSLVSVYWHYEGPDDSPVWDTHSDTFAHMRQRLAPPTDAAIATLLADLHARGLLDDTLVVCLGEFGRTPKIAPRGGRGHWPQAQSILLAGAGVPGGTVYGATDAIGAYPTAQPVDPADLMATFLHQLGIDPESQFRDATGRPHPASRGRVLPDLVS